MLDFEVISHTEIDRSVSVFNRDGFVIIRDALAPDQLALAQSGTRREVANQMAEIPVERANRGYARYSFNQQRIHLPEWYQLIDLPTILPILEQVWEVLIISVLEQEETIRHQVPRFSLYIQICQTF